MRSQLNKQEMEDEAILLKIKRDFTENEAVQSLLKIISSLEIEVGILKSELEEARYKVDRIRKEGTLTKKQWMKEEVFDYMNKEKINLNNKIKQYRKSIEDWQSKYFKLLNERN